jgi:hypothetical protein
MMEKTQQLVSVEKLVFVEISTTNLATIIPRIPVDDGW